MSIPLGTTTPLRDYKERRDTLEQIMHRIMGKKAVSPDKRGTYAEVQEMIMEEELVN